MFATTVDLFQQVFPALRIVVSARDDGLLAELDIHLRSGDQLITALDADLGMGHSLAAGSAGLDWDFTFVGLADMPFVRAETLQYLLLRAETALPADILVPVYIGKPGHPVGFGSAHFPAIQRLSGDQGARSIVGSAQPSMIDVDDEGVLLDLDQPPPSRVAQSSLERHDP